MGHSSSLSQCGSLGPGGAARLRVAKYQIFPDYFKWFSVIGGPSLLSFLHLVLALVSLYIFIMEIPQASIPLEVVVVG